MKQRLMRPTAALFPIAGIAGALWGNRSCTMQLFVTYYLIQLFSLCAADCFRNAAAQEPGVRKVDSRFSGAFLPLIFGAAVTWFLWKYELSQIWRIRVWQGVCIAAILISIEHLFEERMYMLGRRIDGVILSCLTNGLLTAALLMKEGTAMQAQNTGIYVAIGAGIGAAVAVAACYAIEACHDFSLKPANLGFITSAVPQTLLYAAAAAAVIAITKARILDMLPSLLFGLISWRLARTICRRTEDESRALNLILIAVAAIPTAASTLFPMIQPYALASYIALICAAITFTAPSQRFYAGIALTASAFLAPPAISIILALIAILINTNKAFLKKV